VHKRSLDKLIGTLVKLIPKPKMGGKYIPMERNRWLFLGKSKDKKGLELKNAVTNHEFVLPFDTCNEFREPDLLILRGETELMEDGSVKVKPIVDTPEEIEIEEPIEYVEDREQMAKDKLSQLTEPERAAIRQVLVLGSMTATDVSTFLAQKGFSPNEKLMQSLFNNVPFFQKTFGGFYFVKPDLRQILKKLLAKQ